MDTKRVDETTTIAITLEVREMLRDYKLIDQESWNSVIRRLLLAIKEAKLRISEEK